MPRTDLIPDPWLANLLSHIAADYPGIYLAGGRIRDWLLGREGRDVDLCVERKAIPLTRRIANATGGAFYVLDSDTDAARILYREQGVVVDLAGLRGSDIISDLRARDLTVNAMAVRLEDALLDAPPILDPCRGLGDLEARVLRATSEEAFRHDPVRLLRAVRLEAALHFQIESQTESWVRRDANRLANSSPERIRYELLQILGSPDPQAHVLRMQKLGLLEVALPEVAELAKSPAPHERAASEFESTLDALAGVGRLSTIAAWRPAERAAFAPYSAKLAQYLDVIVCDQRTRSFLLRWAALLHRTHLCGRVAVPARPQRAGDVTAGEGAARVTERFCFSAHEVALVRSTVVSASSLMDLAATGVWDRRDLYRYFQRAACGPVEPLLLAWARELPMEGEPGSNAENLRRLAGDVLTHYFSHPEELVTPPAIVTGADVMDWLGLVPGPQVGAVLREIREQQAMGCFSTREEAKELIRATYPRSFSG